MELVFGIAWGLLGGLLTSSGEPLFPTLPVCIFCYAISVAAYRHVRG